jgi:hypothetical protein
LFPPRIFKPPIIYNIFSFHLHSPRRSFSPFTRVLLQTVSLLVLQGFGVAVAGE